MQCIKQPTRTNAAETNATSCMFDDNNSKIQFLFNHSIDSHVIVCHEILWASLGIKLWIKKNMIDSLISLISCGMKLNIVPTFVASRNRHDSNSRNKVLVSVSIAAAYMAALFAWIYEHALTLIACTRIRTMAYYRLLFTRRKKQEINKGNLIKCPTHIRMLK